jgi:hypothetical protein
MPCLCAARRLGDSQCDIGCNVTSCGFDNGDCVQHWKHSPLPPAAAESDERHGGGGLRQPAEASVVAHATIAGVTVEGHALAAVGVMGALLFCCCGCIVCSAVLACVYACWSLQQSKRRYQSYAVVGLEPPSGA